MNRVWVLLAFVSLSPLLGSVAEQCGRQANNTLCPNGLCCSEYGYCGTTDLYCGAGCQSQCWAPPPPVTPPPPPPPFVPPPPPGEGVGSIITSSVFDEMLKYKDSSSCHAPGFYTYDAFITAANAFSEFGTTGDDEARRTELAAFFGQTSHETTGGGTGWDPPDGPFFWGYCYKEEISPSWDYCNPSEQYPCVAGKSYHGRGPMQLSYNVNYGQAGEALGVDLLSNPELVATDPVISFKTAIWFWMTTQAPKPSCHDVMIGAWTPSNNDLAAGRYPGYGLTTNIINGGLECGRGTDGRVEDRIGFYKRYCDMLGVSYGDYLDCYSMTPYGLTLGKSVSAYKAEALWSLVSLV